MPAWSDRMGVCRVMAPLALDSTEQDNFCEETDGAKKTHPDHRGGSDDQGAGGELRVNGCAD